ncbi:MAG: hypothetical protein P4M11_04875 [Candidatus Pacebacteria bacterium]|nr:hypothetical protein [Candidatus Paceibacterota bacterium]
MIDSYMSTAKELKGPEVNEAVAFQANCIFAMKDFGRLVKFFAENKAYCFEEQCRAGSSWTRTSTTAGYTTPTWGSASSTSARPSLCML